MYEYDVECDYFIIILDGSATVQVGKEGMEINAGLFSYYGVNALIDENETDPLHCIGNDSMRKPYKPEFSLKVQSYCVYLQITRAEWKVAVKNSIMERTYGGAKSPMAKSPAKLPVSITMSSSIQSEVNLATEQINNATNTATADAKVEVTSDLVTRSLVNTTLQVDQVLVNQQA